MNQPSVEPEYILAEPAEMSDTESLHNYLNRDFGQVVVEVRQLLQESIKALGMLDDITVHLLALEQSLEDT